MNPRPGRGFLSRTRARVAELADALASGASDRKVVEVRVLSRAPSFSMNLTAPGEHRLPSPLLSAISLPGTLYLDSEGNMSDFEEAESKSNDPSKACK
jgi:hypothetical protein